jgi:hypothetical protein
LAELDPEVKNIIDKETWRQFTGLELIASEVCQLVCIDRHCPEELAEFDEFGGNGGKWLYAHQQVL